MVMHIEGLVKHMYKESKQNRIPGKVAYDAPGKPVRSERRNIFD